MTGYIELDGVTREYGSVVAVDDLSMQIGGGQYHCLLGPNGSGKSTLMRLILGLTRPTSGTVTTQEMVVGCGFQQPNFYPSLTVRQNISVFAGIVEATDWEWNRTVIEELRLTRALDRTAGDLSGGFGRKLDLALAFIKRPDIVLLDEPLGALDDVSTARLLEFLSWYVEQGNTVFISTHRISEFADTLGRVTVLHRGEIAFDRERGEMNLDGESLQTEYVKEILEREGIDANLE